MEQDFNYHIGVEKWRVEGINQQPESVQLQSPRQRLYSLSRRSSLKVDRSLVRPSDTLPLLIRLLLLQPVLRNGEIYERWDWNVCNDPHQDYVIEHLNWIWCLVYHESRTNPFKFKWPDLVICGAAHVGWSGKVCQICFRATYIIGHFQLRSSLLSTVAEVWIIAKNIPPNPSLHLLFLGIRLTMRSLPRPQLHW